MGFSSKIIGYWPVSHVDYQILLMLLKYGIPLISDEVDYEK